jgi:hypothetical protein
LTSYGNVGPAMTSNVGANMGYSPAVAGNPSAYSPMYAPVAHGAHHPVKPVYGGGYSDVGAILVLFILLVIISRTVLL